ncbi:MAG: methylated-DNA--[protein]-cysteine S-methyltransferase [Bacteroidota bacterium]
METTFLTTDFGTFKLTGGPLGLQSVRLWEKAVPKLDLEPQNEHLRAARRQLKEYFRGERRAFDLKLDWSEATDFYRNVWAELTKIPYGRTTSYQFIAERLGDKNAIRAVGQANGRNPIAIIVPCHRVIAKNGDLQGYFYGLDFKRRLLALENPMSFGEQGSLF